MWSEQGEKGRVGGGGGGVGVKSSRVIGSTSLNSLPNSIQIYKKKNF